MNRGLTNAFSKKFENFCAAVSLNFGYNNFVKMHGANCGAAWHSTVLVHEVFQSKTVWQGDVEVFDLTGHPNAKRAYAWSHLDGPKDERERFVALLEIPPVDSAQKAVQVQIVKDIRGKK